MFADRQDAGEQLAQRLRSLKPANPVVLALPRGGVPIGFAVARALGAPLDLVLVRKIGAPGQEELAIGAIADGAAPELVLDEALAGQVAVPPSYVESAKAAALREIERRRQAWLGDRQPIALDGRTAIVVDDGIATGATMRAALRATRRRSPARLVLAVPVAPDSSLQELRAEVDQIVCLDTPDDFMAVGQFYEWFPQLDDNDVVTLLEQARGFVKPPT